MMRSEKPFLSGKRIDTKPIKKNINVVDLVDRHFEAYNSARLREACHLFSKKMLNQSVTVGMSITGALTPAGLDGSCIVPLMKAGFVDWLVSREPTSIMIPTSQLAIRFTADLPSSMTGF